MVDVQTVRVLDESGDWPISIPMIEDGWYPTGGDVDPASNSGIANWQPQLLAARTRLLKERVDYMSLAASDLVTVGAGGDFATINDALVELSRRRPAYVPGGFSTELRLMGGFVMREQVIVRGINMSWVRITAENAEVQIDRAYLTAASAGAVYPAFAASDGGRLPMLFTLFVMMATGSQSGRVGMHLINGGEAFVAAGAGFKGACESCVLMNSASRLSANNSIFSGAAGNNVSVQGASNATLWGSDLRNSGSYGLYASHGSTVTVGGAQFAGCAGAVDAQLGAWVVANTATCRVGAADAATDIRIGGGSMVSARNATGGTSVTPNTVTANGIIYM